MQKLNKPYKGGSGAWLTEALFYDRWLLKRPDERVYEPVFTFYEKRPGLRCAMDDFVELGDPTGYKWAMTYLGDWNHFQRLMNTPWFPAVFAEWNRTLEIKLKSEAMDTIRDIAAGTSSQALAAAKFLAETGWKPKHTKGRPSKAQVDEAAKQMAKIQQEHNTDAERIGLKLVKG